MNKLEIIKRVYREVLKYQWLSISFIIFLSVICGFLEIFSIGMLIPIVSITLETDTVLNETLLANVNLFFNVNDKSQLLILLVSAFSILVIFSAIMRVLLLVKQSRFSTIIINKVNEKIYKSMFMRDYLDHVKSDSSEVISAISVKVNQVSYTVIVPMINIMSQTIIAIFIAGALIYINTKLFFLVFIILSFIYYFFIRAVSKRLNKIGEEYSKANNQIVSLVKDAVFGFREILILKKQNYFRENFVLSDWKLRNAQHWANVFQSSPRVLIESLVICMLIFFIILTITLTQDLNKFLFFSEIAALIFGAQKLIPIFNREYQDWANIEANLAPMVDVLDMQKSSIAGNVLTTVEKNKDNIQEIKLENNILFDSIYFNYDDKHESLIENLSFEIKKNEWFCIFGPTGCGKSTLLDIIVGLIQPNLGKVKIDNTILDNSNSHLWHSKIAYVSQKIYLLNGTILENIAFGSNLKDIDYEKAKKSLLHANFLRDVEKFKDGLNTIVGEDGATLSGGQIQRLGLARALYLDREVLILDEATSSLDNKTEEIVLTNLRNLSKNEKTVIAITHKKNTLEFYDRVLYLQDGVVKK